jgi:hypothetical protein
MTNRLRPRVLKLYNDLELHDKVFNYPVYVSRIVFALYNLDEILTEYELGDTAFTEEYAIVYRQWVTLERAFYKVMKRLRKCHF